MAPRSKKNLPAPARKIGARRFRRQRSRRNPSQRSPLGALIVRGVNAILNVIPAAKMFQPVADFMFKSFGFTTALLDANSISATVNVYGMGAAFAVPLSAIIENTPSIPKHHEGNKVQLYTSFTHGKLLQIRVTVRPIGELAHRQGNIALAFIPYTTSASGTYYDANVAIPHIQDVLLVPGAVQGSGTRTLSVNFRARGQQFCSMPHPLDTEIGLVLVSYEDLSRNTGKEFAAEDFGAEIIISGAVKLSNPLPHVGFAAVDCSVHDKLVNKTIRIGDYTVINGECEDKDKSVFVTGLFQESTFNRTVPNVTKKESRSHQPEGSPLSVISMLEDLAPNA